MFLSAVAGVAAAVGCGVALPAAAAAPVATAGPDGVASVNRGRQPAQWGTALPGIVSTFAPVGRQLALTFDACDHACDDALLNTLEQNNIPAVLFVCSKWI